MLQVSTEMHQLCLLEKHNNFTSVVWISKIQTIIADKSNILIEFISSFF